MPISLPPESVSQLLMRPASGLLNVPNDYQYLSFLGGPPPLPTAVGDTARKWQGFESRFPKEQSNPVGPGLRIPPQIYGKNKGFV